MNRIILNSDVINELIKNNNLNFQTKFQKENGKNYFFNQTISLCLYNPKVAWIDSTKKNISFSFNKHEHLNLFIMLRYINEKLIQLYNNKIGVNLSIHSFFYEKDDFFYIKCYLPNIHSKKYLIKSYFNSNEDKFNVPRLGTIYSSVILDIRNIWEKNNKVGFNLELKEVHI